MSEILIKGGKVVSAERTIDADVAVDGGKISAVGPNLGEAARIIDATGKYVIPGGIDPHVHILLQFMGNSNRALYG